MTIAIDDIVGNYKVVKITDKVLLKDLRTGSMMYKTIEEAERLTKKENKIYNIRLQSPFLLLPNQVKEKLGIGYKVLSIEIENELAVPDITDIDSAVEAIVKVGYRSLARANHPDLGGDVRVMSIINKAKSELLQLLKEVKA